MNIAVIGGGSIGLLISSYLAEQHKVSLYVRRESQKKKINQEQINRINYGEHHRITTVNAKLLEEIQSNMDLCIICVKQTQLNDVLTKITMIEEHIPLLFLQNGMGHIELLKHVANPSYVGVINHGSHRTLDNEVHHLGNGSIDIANFTGNKSRLETLVKTLHTPMFPVYYHADWEVILKEKLLVNAVINPLTALFDVANGKIITNQFIHQLAEKLCTETADVLQLPLKASWQRVINIAEQTSDNVSSMRSDIQSERETEVEAITGYIIQKANSPVPYTTFIYEAILALQLERT